MSKATEGVVFYFVGPLGTEAEKLRLHVKSLSKYVYKSVNKDEIDQGARQTGKGVLIFSDTKYALEFMSDISFPGIAMYYCLLIDRNGSYSPEVMKQFRLLGLEFYTPNKVEVLNNELKKFMSGGEYSIGEEELDFVVPTDKDK